MNQKMLSICIPTYNRAASIKSLLEALMPQIIPIKESIEICISNNASSDNTRTVAMCFVREYPDVIKYNENEENLGFDRNVVKVVSMASGHFVWLLGDDDRIVENGLENVMAFIRKNNGGNIGLILLRKESYFMEKNSKKKLVYDSTLVEKAPVFFKLKREDIVAGSFPSGSFMSVLIFNNFFLKRALKENSDIIQKGVGTYYIHVLLYRLIFLKYNEAIAYVLNKIIICQKIPHYKFSVEDEFRLLVHGSIALEDVLLSTKYSKNYASVFAKKKRVLKVNFIYRLIYMKAFKTFNYHARSNCLNLFFTYFAFNEALLFSVFFVLVSAMPSVLLRTFLLSQLKRVHKAGWEKQWFSLSTVFTLMSNGSRRRINEPGLSR